MKNYADMKPEEKAKAARAVLDNPVFGNIADEMAARYGEVVLSGQTQAEREEAWHKYSAVRSVIAEILGEVRAMADTEPLGGENRQFVKEYRGRSAKRSKA